MASKSPSSEEGYAETPELFGAVFGQKGVYDDRRHYYIYKYVAQAFGTLRADPFGFVKPGPDEHQQKHYRYLLKKYARYSHGFPS